METKEEEKGCLCSQQQRRRMEWPCSMDVSKSSAYIDHALATLHRWSFSLQKWNPHGTPPPSPTSTPANPSGKTPR